jgi:hypothetical protein
LCSNSGETFQSGKIRARHRKMGKKRSGKDDDEEKISTVNC